MTGRNYTIEKQRNKHLFNLTSARKHIEDAIPSTFFAHFGKPQWKEQRLDIAQVHIPECWMTSPDLHRREKFDKINNLRGQSRQIKYDCMQTCISESNAINRLKWHWFQQSDLNNMKVTTYSRCNQHLPLTDNIGFEI